MRCRSQEKFAGLGMEVIQENGHQGHQSDRRYAASRAGIRAGTSLTERHNRAGAVDGRMRSNRCGGTKHKDYTDDQARRRR